MGSRGRSSISTFGARESAYAPFPREHLTRSNSRSRLAQPARSARGAVTSFASGLARLAGAAGRLSRSQVPEESPLSAVDSPPYIPFAISVVPDRDEVAVVPIGDLDITSVDEVQQAVVDLRSAGFGRILVDLRGVGFIDSTGLRMLISLRNDAKRTGYSLTLTGARPAAERIFKVTGTRGLFEWRSSGPFVEPRDRPQHGD